MSELREHAYFVKAMITNFPCKLTNEQLAETVQLLVTKGGVRGHMPILKRHESENDLLLFIWRDLEVDKPQLVEIMRQKDCSPELAAGILTQREIANACFNHRVFRSMKFLHLLAAQLSDPEGYRKVAFCGDYPEMRRKRPPFKAKPKRIWVSWYMEDRAYGGPEEGGWWYDYGQPVVPDWGVPAYHAKPRSFRNIESARDYMHKLNRLYTEALNEGRPSTSSVASRGQYRVYMDEGKPAPWPKYVPRYC